MQTYIYLSVLLTVAAGTILRYGDNTDQATKDIIPSPRRKNIQHQYISHPFNHNHEGASNSIDYQSRVLETKNCVMITETIANCSNQGITDVSQINVPETITWLDLSYNLIESIPDFAFKRFTLLEYLNIGQNNLQVLYNNSFYHLSHLKVLQLQGNNLIMSADTFPVNVFQPLLSLQQLWIHNNTNRQDVKPRLDYPDKALAQLKNVTDLRMDGLTNKSFGDGFNQMISLTKLTLQGEPDGYCNLVSLGENMFNNTKLLTHLSLIFCKINGTKVNPLVFLPLKNLNYLDLSHNDALHFDHLSSALLTLRKNNSSLKFLNITNIVNPYLRGWSVTSDFSKSLPRQIEVLNASSNALEALEDGVLQTMPKSLKLIDIGSNKFAFMSYLKNLDQLVNLEILILNGGQSFNLPWYYPPDADHLYSSNERTHLLDLGDYHKIKFLEQALPPKLKKLYSLNAGLSNYLTEFHFNANNSLKLLNLNYNNFPSLQGPIIGLNKLEHLSLFDCRIREIYRTFFQNLTSLKFLNLSTNYFGNVAFRNNQSLFADLVNLTVLDLSFTDIRYISYESFLGLDMLEFLFLQINPILKFDVDMSSMIHLQYINMSFTNIGTLSPNVTNMFDQIRRISTHFTIDITGVTFNCFCNSREFLKWATTTNVLRDVLDVNCNFMDESQKEIKTFKNVYRNLQRECSSNLQLLSIVISATFLLIMLMIVAIMYNFRWKLRYLYYSAILHYKNQKNNDQLIEFEYDVFVSYAHEDNDFVVNTLYPQLQSQGLKIHIHGLHFTAGEYISSNIVNAIHNSRRTLVVLTKNHLNSKWCKYEVEMANMEQIHTGRCVLLFLIMEDTPKPSTHLLFHIKNNTYIMFPKSQNNEMYMMVLWSKLVNDLRS